MHGRVWGVSIDSRIPVGVLMVVIGLALVFGTGMATYVQQMVTAEPVDATVESTNITRIPCSVDESCRYRYSPVVTYSYSYKGKDYTNDDVFASGANSGDKSRSWAENILNDYSEGEQVTAYVLPGKPGKAFLIRNRPNMVFMLFSVLGALMALAGINGVRQGFVGAERPGMSFE